MSDKERLQRGMEMFDEVYSGLVPLGPPEQMDDFLKTMLQQLFGEVWTRDGLSVRDRRLIALGAIAGMGEADLYDIQIRAARKNGELSTRQVREMLIFLAQYVGYPRMSRLRPTVEKVLAELGD